MKFMNVVRSDAGEKPSRVPKKKVLTAAGIVAALIIIAVVSVYVIFQEPAHTEGPVSPSGTGSAVSPQVSQVQHPAGSRTSSPQTVSYTPLKTQELPVDFVLRPGEQTSCGLTCRQLTVAIANTGSETAHDVCITVALHNSKNEVINLNGDPSIRRCIGDIAGGEEKSEPITINADCGVFATRCIGETLTLQTQVSSVEKTIRFPDQVIKV